MTHPSFSQNNSIPTIHSVSDEATDGCESGNNDETSTGLITSSFIIAKHVCERPNSSNNYDNNEESNSQNVNKDVENEQDF